jgi:hypothetical protein
MIRKDSINYKKHWSTYGRGETPPISTSYFTTYWRRYRKGMMRMLHDIDMKPTTKSTDEPVTDIEYRDMLHVLNDEEILYKLSIVFMAYYVGNIPKEELSKLFDTLITVCKNKIAVEKGLDG